MINTFNFTLDRQYMTAQDLICAMNMNSRFVLPTQGFTVESYRFVIDTANRFKLITRPGNQHQHWYITYAGSDAMNKILGFVQTSAIIRFTPSSTDMFCRAVDYLHSVAIKQYHTDFHAGSLEFLGMDAGTVYRNKMNRILVQWS